MSLISGVLGISCCKRLKLNSLTYVYNCISLRVHDMQTVNALLYTECFSLTPLYFLLLYVLKCYLMALLRNVTTWAMGLSVGSRMRSTFR